MPFDLKSFDTATAGNLGAEMELVDPATGQPARDDEGRPVTITLLGRNSDAARDCGTRQARRRLANVKRGRRGVEYEDIENDTVELLTACTVGWSFTEVDDVPFPWSPENARKLWADPRWRGVREQADQFIGDDANFLRRDR